MKIKMKDMQRIIKEEVDKQKEKIIQIAQDALPGSDVDLEAELDEIPDEREDDVMDALESLDEEQIQEMVRDALKNPSK